MLYTDIAVVYYSTRYFVGILGAIKLKKFEDKSIKNAEAEDIENNSEKSSQKKVVISVSVAVALLAVVIIAIGIIVGCSDDNNALQSDTPFVSESSEDFYSELSKINLSDIDITNKTNKFVKGITINGYNLAGSTYNEAYTYIETNYHDLIEKMSFVIDCDGTKNTLTEKDFVFNADVLKAVNEAYAISSFARSKHLEKLPSDTDIKLDYEIEEESVSMAVAKIAELVDDKAVGIQLVSFDPYASSGNQFVFKDGGAGKALDREDVTNQLKNLIDEGKKEGTVTCTKKVPEGGLVATDLNKKMRLISTYSTYSTNTSNANHNMSLALSSVDGTLLMPGETFSFNACTGDSNLTSMGYLTAGVIINGKSSTGVGGGICQASTTIYNAALRAGLTVVERYPHAWPSTYVQQGLDATIDYPNLDLKLKNSDSYPVYFNCYMSGTTLTCNVYGVPSSEWDEITCDSWISGYGSGGDFFVSASRTFWLNGKAVRTESLKSSKYNYGKSSSNDDDDNSSKKASSKSSSKSSSKTSSAESSSTVSSEIISYISSQVSSNPIQNLESNSSIISFGESSVYSSDYSYIYSSDYESATASSTDSPYTDTAASDETSAQFP